MPVTAPSSLLSKVQTKDTMVKKTHNGLATSAKRENKQTEMAEKKNLPLILPTHKSQPVSTKRQDTV